MAYDKDIADRLRELIAGAPDTTERAMFGGLAFMVRGNMACGVTSDAVMARVGPEAYEEVLLIPRVEELSFTGRPMRGMVQISLEDAADEELLSRIVDRGIEFASSLPPKRKKNGSSG